MLCKGSPLLWGEGLGVRDVFPPASMFGPEVPLTPALSLQGEGE